MSDISPTFVIHHLSDLHIGPLHYSASNKLPFVKGQKKPRSHKLYIDFLQHRPDNDLPDLIIFSGDFTSYATEQEFYAANDFIKDVLQELRRKHASWRSGPEAPYFLMVPGNHDLDWTQDTYEQKVTRYARLLADPFANRGVISSRYSPHTPAPVYWDFGNAVNVSVYLFDTTSLGGIEEPVLKEAYQTLKTSYTRLLDTPAGEEYLKALDTLKREIRRDPGYLRPEDLDEMMNIVLTGQIPRNRVKIAVMHHNPTSVPSDDIEVYDTIINAGITKSKLLDAGFDLVLHGHRHVSNCTHERLLQGSEEWQQGIFLIGADSIGCKESAPFFELRLFNSETAHSVYPPACVFELRLVESDGRRYTVSQSPLAEEAIHRPMYGAIGDMLRGLGRPMPDPRRQATANYLRNLLPHLHSLNATSTGWDASSNDWIANFHFLLGRYSKIYATDLHLRSSFSAGRFDNYLREQYKARLKRLKGMPTRSLRFSAPVVRAIKRTGWKPDRIQWKDYNIEASASATDTGLEIARIVVRDKNTPELIEELERLNFDHKMFAIPLFVLEPADIPASGSIDFALAFNDAGGLLTAYEFVKTDGKVRQVGLDRGAYLENLFLELLEHKALKTVDQFLNYGHMIRDPKTMKEFAEKYDDFRRASPTLLRVLREAVEATGSGRGLDLGCGTGNYTVPFQDKFTQVVGLDANHEMLQIARRKSDKIEWLHADALNSGLPDNNFDAIWLVSTLHYFTDIYLERLFEEVYRMLVPGGVLVADTEFAEQHKSLWVVDFFPSLQIRYKDACLPKATFERLLKNAGFSDVRFDYCEYRPDEGDWFLRIGQHQPDLYLRFGIRDAVPAFKEMDFVEFESGSKRLQDAIRSGEIQRIIAEYESRAEMAGDVGFILARR